MTARRLRVAMYQQTVQRKPSSLSEVLCCFRESTLIWRQTEKPTRWCNLNVVHRNNINIIPTTPLDSSSSDSLKHKNYKILSRI